MVILRAMQRPPLLFRLITFVMTIFGYVISRASASLIAGSAKNACVEFVPTSEFSHGDLPVGFVGRDLPQRARSRGSRMMPKASFGRSQSTMSNRQNNPLNTNCEIKTPTSNKNSVHSFAAKIFRWGGAIFLLYIFRMA